MVTNKSSVNHDGLGEVFTQVDVSLENETGSTATLCVRAQVYSVAEGVSGWGISASTGYTGNNDELSAEVGNGVIDYDNIAVDGINKWPIKKTHDGWTAHCFAKSIGEIVDDRNAYPLGNEVTCDIEIPATTSYTVAYDANGGTNAPSSQTKFHDETLILSATKPTKAGHTFIGWGISDDDVTVDYAPAANYSENKAITLYAIWEINTWSVEYNANGGVNAPDNQVKEYNNDLTLSSAEPTREGYIFKGWSTSKAGNVEYQPSGTYAKNEAVTLYAIWEIITYEVTYNANGGVSAPEKQLKRYGEPLILSSDVPTRDGHDFLGWGTTAEDTTVDYASGASYSENKAITLYAIWEIHTWDVKYDANNGTGAPANQTKVYNQNLVLSSVKPTRTGYTFKGWATSSSGGVSYQPGGTYEGNEPLTLYAVWEIIVYTITYDANGGYDAPAKQNKDYGATISISVGEPLRDQYKFLGWSTSQSGTVTHRANDPYFDNANLTLYAVWELIPIMKMLNGYEICDSAAREQISGVTTTGTGSSYAATVKGIPSLVAGINFMMVPHTVSTSVSPTLNVNGLGAKAIKQRLSSSSSALVAGDTESWLAAGKPVKVVYEGEYWVADISKPDANYLYGTAPIANGGTGADTVAGARNNLGLGNTDGALPVANGGTGATNGMDALKNLGISWGVDAPPTKGAPNSIYIQIN